MVQEISNGVLVSVEVFYHEKESKPQQNIFLFAYRITLENVSAEPIKLISRQWFIFDSNGASREVVGDGVVGQQPIIAPGKSFQYVSGCPLESELGYMRGFYTFENKSTLKSFKVNIPLFHLVAPQKLN